MYRDYNNREYVVWDATSLTDEEVQLIVDFSVQTSIDTLTKSRDGNYFLTKFENNPLPALNKVMKHMSHRKRRGKFREDVLKSSDPFGFDHLLDNSEIQLNTKK